MSGFRSTPQRLSSSLHLSSRLASPAPRRSRCSRGFIHGLLAALLGASLAGCVTTPSRMDNPMEESGAEEIELLVRNHNFSQATIYIAPEHGARRLGIVNGKSEATFKFPWHLAHIQLRVKYLAGREFLTETLTVNPDDLLELILVARAP